MSKPQVRQITYEQMKQFGQQFKSMRESIGLTSKEMSFEFGCHQTTILKWEKGTIPQEDIFDIQDKFKRIVEKYPKVGKRSVYILDNIITVDDYIDMKVKGYNDTRILMELYVGENTLQRWKTRNGITKKLVNQKRYEIITEMLNEGNNLEVIAGKLKLTVKQCRNILNRYKVCEMQPC